MVRNVPGGGLEVGDEVRVDELVELDEAGLELGQQGRQQHLGNTFSIKKL